MRDDATLAQRDMAYLGQQANSEGKNFYRMNPQREVNGQ